MLCYAMRCMRHVVQRHKGFTDSIISGPDLTLSAPRCTRACVAGGQSDWGTQWHWRSGVQPSHLYGLLCVFICTHGETRVCIHTLSGVPPRLHLVCIRGLCCCRKGPSCAVSCSCVFTASLVSCVRACRHVWVLFVSVCVLSVLFATPHTWHQQHSPAVCFACKSSFSRVCGLCFPSSSVPSCR